MGNVSGVIDKTLFIELAPFMSVLALSIILFEAGINANIRLFGETLGKATVLSTLTILSSIVAVGMILSIIFLPLEFDLLQGMLLGAMVGGTSTVAVYGILKSTYRTREDQSSAQVLLTLESVISDPICIILSITLIKMIMQPDILFIDGIRDIMYVFISSFFVGLFLGIIWANIISRLRGPYTYMITLAVLFSCYIGAERILGEGAGAMTALTFGLAIVNYNYLMMRLGLNWRISLNTIHLKELHDEITFLIKSFFFVYIGIISSFSVKYTFLGLGISIVMVFLRFLIVSVLGNVLRFTIEETIFSQVIYASGLPAFVMSQLPKIFDDAGLFFINPDVYTNLCMPIVIGSLIFSGLFGPVLARRAIRE
jgi:cell volume regulation protein A